MSAFEKVFSNLDIMRNLFDFLDIGDQFRFGNVNQQLQFVFCNFIWRNIDYKTIDVKKYSDTIRLRNGDTINHMHYDLTYEEYEYFLNIFGQQVEELNESHGNALNISQHFKNLTTIKYNYLLITKKQILLLADLCPQLENLFFNGCCNKKHDLLRLGPDIGLQFLLAMSKLKSFSLRTGVEYKIKCGFVDDCTKGTQLPLNVNSSVESFDIYMSTLATGFLGLFAHLKTLIVTVFNTVTNEEIIALAHACKHLKELTFKSICFENIENFSSLQTLSDLVFYHCDGLTYENLKDILSRTQLVNFTSIGTDYSGLFHYYFLSPTVKSINIDGIKTLDFKTLMESS